MTKYGLKLRGLREKVFIEAAEMVEEKPLFAEEPVSRTFKDAQGKVVAQFAGKEIAGWWIEPENTSLADAIRQGRERVKKVND